MTAVAEKWVAGSGVGLTWTNAFTNTTLNNISANNGILSDVSIDNSSALDMFCDVSISIPLIATAAGISFIGIMIYPLNKDGSTYGDGRFGTQAAVSLAMVQSYYVGAIFVPGPAATSTAIGTLTGIPIPPGVFKFVIWNSTSTTFANAGANSCKYRTYNRGHV